VHINQIDTSGRGASVDKKGEDGNGALATEVDAFEINLHGERFRNCGCMMADDTVDPSDDLLRSIGDLCLEIWEHGGTAFQLV